MQNSAGSVIYGNHCCCIKANMKTCISISILTVSLLSISPHSARATDAEQTQSLPATSDGQRDFDFAVGTWKTRVRRLLKPLAGSNDWVEGTGTVSTRKVWGGRAQLEELTMDTGDTHLKGLALRLYNPKTHQWRLQDRKSTRLNSSHLVISYAV